MANRDPASGLFSSPAKRTLVLCLLLTAATLALYAPVTHSTFVNFDDDAYIIHNAHVRAGLTWNTVKWSFTQFEEGNWHPLTWISHALDVDVFGLNPAGHHLVNVFLHVINVAILFYLLQSATGCTWRSLVVAALFAVHPVNVESVAWVAERKNVLSMFFFLLALLAYGWYARSPQFRRYGLMLFLFLLALMSKPQVITFPFLLLLWDYWPLGRMAIHSKAGVSEHRPAIRQFSALWLVLEKVPLFLLSAASAVVTMMAQRSGHALRTAADYSLLNRLETAVTSYVRYMGTAIWPSGLAVFYPHSTSLFPMWQVVAALLLLILATAVTLWRWRERPYLLVGWFWFLVAMLPMIGLVQVGGQALADRYVYIPFIGLFVMMVWTVTEWAGGRRIPAAWLAITSAIVLVALAAVTHRQIRFWRDTPTMWRRALDVTQDNFVAHTNLATYLDQQGQVEEGVVHLRAALAIKPDDPPALLGLGTYEQQHGDLPDAVELYQMVALHAVNPELRFTAYSNLGSAYRQMRDYADAKDYYEAALRISPGRPIAMVGLGLIAQHDGDYVEAIRQFSNAMAVEPTDIGYLLLAHALRQAGRSMEAQDAQQQAKSISGNVGEAQREADTLLSGK